MDKHFLIIGDGKEILAKIYDNNVEHAYPILKATREAYGEYFDEIIMVISEEVPPKSVVY